MTKSQVALALAVVAPGVVAAQQPTSADEKQIRDLIASGKPLPPTKDAIFWSGAYKRPVVGSEKPEEVGGERAPSNRVPGSERTKTTVRRIEIAKAGDLAYEFSDGELSFDVKGGKPVSLTTSALRVWRKEGGEWRVAAVFVRPHAP